MSSKKRKANHISAPTHKAYLYQWVNFEEDFLRENHLKKLGGDHVAANRFRGIEDDVKNAPLTSHWLVAARIKNGEWRITALLKVRPATEEERLEVVGKYDKYLYFDVNESGFLALPGEEPINDEQVSNAIKKAVPGITQGENGKVFDIPRDAISRLRKKIKLSLNARLAQLVNDVAISGSSTPPLVVTTTLAAKSAHRDASISIETKNSDDASINASAELSIAATTEVIDNNGLKDEAIAGLQNELESDVSKIDDLNVGGITGKDIDVIAKRRIGQGPFRKLLATLFGGKCCISGLDKMDLLIASHIVPWSKSDRFQKTDRENGLLLSVSWDAVFDKGYISFDYKGNLLWAKLLDQQSARFLGISTEAKLDEKWLTDERRAYLSWHRDNVFRDGRLDTEL